MSVYRIYVEKKEEFAVEATQLANDIRVFLRIPRLDSLRVLNRYDVEGIEPELFEQCKTTVFSEPQVDDIYDEAPVGQHTLAVEYLPGQYDQRADSCAQCIQIVSQKQRPSVRTARIFLLSGSLTEEDLVSVKNYLINPVESREASSSTFDTLVEQYETPPPVSTVEGFLTMSADTLSEFLQENGLAMDLSDLTFCQEYFRKENRDPSFTEIKMIDTYWSDHCRHTTFQTMIDEVKIEDQKVQAAYDSYRELRKSLGRDDRAVTLMDLATIGAKHLVKTGELKGLDVSEEINACSVKIPVDADGVTEEWLLMFKNETHNHPTEIEPFGGAATCIGGAIRDPLSGRSYVYQAMRITGAGDPLTPVEETLAGKLPQRKIVTTAAAGYSSYGNQIGLATGLVNEIYHPGYVAKRMELGAVIGAAPARQVIREVTAPGDAIILLGGKTGRDGCGGATGSSKSHSIESLSQCGAEVQKGNAPEERKIQRLFRDEKVTRLIKRCNDFGAGGVSVAIGELADGLAIDLDVVPKKYEGLDGTELAISESQERMAVVVAEKDVALFMSYTKEENIEATVVAHVTDNNRLCMNWRGQKIVDISREFLNSNGAAKHTTIAVPLSDTAKFKNAGGLTSNAGSKPGAALSEVFTATVTDLNVCSQKGLVERFDSTIGASSVLMPLGGSRQATPAQAMAAKLPVLSGKTSTCSVMAYGFDPFVTEADPFSGAYLAVVESLAKIVACGASTKNAYLSFQEYFEKLGNDPTRWGKPFSALLGALKAQTELGVGAIGGKDSMSGSFEEIHVPPTLVSFAVSYCNAANVISPEFKKAGSRIALLSPVYDEAGLPLADSLSTCFATVERLISEKKALSAFTLTKGGASEALFKMSLGNRIGFSLADEVDPSLLSKKAYGSFVVELADDAELLKSTQTSFTIIGKTSEAYTISKGTEEIEIAELETLYEGKLASVYPSEVTINSENDIVKKASSLFSISFDTKTIPGFARKAPAIKSAAPIALIPVFPGTNCEYDTARALSAAGAKPQVIVIRNLSPEDIAESVKEIASQIARSQIIVLPGGFSGGDEPDGSGKFITAFFRNPLITEQVREFLNQRDGLMLGICNGFQALIKLGLVPYGDIRDMDVHCPTLAMNRIGRHQSRLIQTRVASNLSPWLMGSEIGDLHTLPISHGEGRFVIEEPLLKDLIAKGQIATQYVDLSGAPTMEIQYNPNGSLLAVEGITSPDGRVFGKMGHSERRGDFVHKNVPGNMDQKLFENAVRYYSL